MVKGKNKIRAFLYGNILIAVVLGVYAQDIAYFLYNRLTIPLMAGLSAVTMFSIFLFLSPPILISKFNKKHKIGKNEFSIYFGINLLLGIVISAFSLIVLVAWCG
ncbi:MAG TPA: hypothetical protein VFC70_03420 [Oscillospiraceae bacterium]|nr:hypothetical protein [Oscillospiraceae bacterium]